MLEKYIVDYMSDILNRVGLAFGFMASLFLAMGILGESRLKRFEKSSRQTLTILINPIKFIKSVYSQEEQPFVIWIALPLSLVFYALPAILKKQIAEIPILSTFLNWFTWMWGLPSWIYFTIFFTILFTGPLILIVSNKRVISWPIYMFSLVMLVIFAPALPFIIIWFPIWFVMLILTSIFLWLITSPIQIGFYLKKKIRLHRCI